MITASALTGIGSARLRITVAADVAGAPAVPIYAGAGAQGAAIAAPMTTATDCAEWRETLRRDLGRLTPDDARSLARRYAECCAATF
jgi:hypothetical protein